MSDPEKNNSLPKKKEDVEEGSTDSEAEDEKLNKAQDDFLAPTQDEQDAAKTKPRPNHDDVCHVCTEICVTLRCVDESKSGGTSKDEDEIIGDLLLNEVLHAAVRSSNEDQEVPRPKPCCQSPSESLRKIDDDSRGSKTCSCKEEKQSVDILVTDVPDQPDQQLEDMHVAEKQDLCSTVDLHVPVLMQPNELSISSNSEDGELEYPRSSVQSEDSADDH